MNRISALIFSALLTAGLSLSGAEAAGDAKHPEAVDWSFNGLFGTYAVSYTHLTLPTSG